MANSVYPAALPDPTLKGAAYHVNQLIFDDGTLQSTASSASALVPTLAGNNTFAGSNTFSSAIVASGGVTGNASTASALTASQPAPLSLASGDAGAAAASGTVNKVAGTCTLDHTTGAVYTLTNSLIVSGVKVFAVLNTNDATGKGIQSIVLNTTNHTAVFTLQATPAANVVISFFLLAFA